MSARRTLIIIVAIAIGAVAAVSTVLYVNSVQSRANGNAKMVAVYQIVKDIPAKTTGDTAIAQGLVKKGSIPKQYYPPSAVVDVNEIKGKVAPYELVPGAPLVEKQFVEPKVATTSFSATNIPAGQMAITISLDPTKAVAGLVVPGDKVDLMTVIAPTDREANPPKPANQFKYAHFFYQNVNVIAIGTSAAPKQGETAAPTNPGSGLYTLAVPPEAAERIVMASLGGTVYMALVPPDNQPVNIPVVPGGLVDGPNPPTVAQAPQLTPYAQ